MGKDGDMQEFLANLIEKDPGAIEFLEDQGWEFTKTAADGAAFKTQTRFFDHKFFYLNTIFGGMGFGPQFRSVNPSKVTMKNNNHFGITVSQLTETESWQMHLNWRPGYMDSGIQNGGTAWKAWTDP